MIEYLVLILIFALAALLGFFVNRALQAQKLREVEDQLDELQKTKNTLATVERNLIVAQVERDKSKEAEEKIKADYFRLTLSFKNLQEDLARERATLRQQYEIPPELPRLKESNRLLAIEIEKLRRKMRKWKSKDANQVNQKLRKKLKKANRQLAELKEEQLSKIDIENYQALYVKIQALGQEAKTLLKNEKNVQDPLFEVEEESGFFSRQPEVRKKQIFQDIISEGSTNGDGISAFDLSDEQSDSTERGLTDLIDIDSKVYAVLINAGIEDFDDLIDTKINDLRMLLEIAALDPNKYQFATWPLQARLAQKGDWDLIEEFRKG